MIALDNYINEQMITVPMRPRLQTKLLVFFPHSVPPPIDHCLCDSTVRTSFLLLQML